MIPGKYRQLIQARDKVPACGDVSSEEDAEREDGDWVHEVVGSCPVCQGIRERVVEEGRVSS